MCIIAYKAAGLNPPDTYTLENCFIANPDGAGLAVIKPNSKVVSIDKGFMEMNTFMNFCQQNVKKEDIAVYHFRIATAGTVTPQNCHPFPVSSKIADLTALNVNCRYAFVHNGILGQGEGSLSDTQVYIKNKLAPRFTSLTKKDLDRIANETKGSRVVLMDGKTHQVSLLGEGWITDTDGIQYSNYSYTDSYYKHSWNKNVNWDDYYKDTIMCPQCSKQAELISFTYDLYECTECGCLCDGNGKLLSLYYDE